MSGPTTFSYAQAAKGHKAQTNPLPTTPNGHPESHARDDASSVTTGGDGTAKTFSTTSEISESAKSSQIDVDVGPKKISDVNVGESGVSTEQSRHNSTTLSDETIKPAPQSSTNERPARQSNRSGEQNDTKKGRKGKKSKSSDKEAENEQAPAEPEKEVIPVKLFEAPPPTVNIWQQRAAAAKAKQPANSPSPLATADSSSKTAPETSTKKAGAEDVHNSERVRSPTKFADGSRPSGDQSGRRNPRGSREKSEPSASHNTPAVGDASMWPTPETAATADDDKRSKSASETDQSAKERQEDAGQPKTNRQKRDWKKVDITPTVIFNTPMPQPRTMNKARGGGQASRNSVNRGHVASASVSNEKPQGPAPEAPVSKEEPQGKPREDAPPRNNSVPVEKPKKFSVDQTRKQSTPSLNRGEYAPSSKNEALRASKNDSSQSFPSRGEGQDVRKEGGFPGHKENNSKPRRGAHGNGRGGHNGGQAPYGQPFLSNGHNSRASTYSPPTFTPNGHPSSGYGGSGRGGRRPVSMSNGYKGPSNGAPKVHMQPPMTSEYGQYPPFSHTPFPPYPGFNPEYLSLMHATLKTQIEYYFSKENLPKDLFLKSKMDAQGFVPMDVIGNFPRIRQISGQNLDFVREACADSQDIDYVLGDGKELLRRREGWQKYLVPEENKKEQVRAPGPSTVVFRSKHSIHLNPFHQQQQPLPYSYNPMSPSAYGPSYSGDMYASYVNGPGFPPAMNGAAPVNGQPAGEDAGLNAAVPEFSPKFSADGFNDAAGEWIDHALQGATTFTDEQVAGLHMVAQGQTAPSMVNGTSSADAKTNGVHT